MAIDTVETPEGDGEIGALSSETQALLDLIPADSKYAPLRHAIDRIGTSFPGELREITPERLQGWIDEIDTGSGRGRDADQIRDDIFQYVVGRDVIVSVLGVTPEQADQLIKGGNDGGINFSDLVYDEEGTARIDVPPTGGDPTDTTEDQLTILQGEDMEWYFDPSTGNYYVSYGLPGTAGAMVFEATDVEMDQLFGEGIRPDAEETSFQELIGQEDVYFGQSIVEMAGEGSFEEEYWRQVTIGLEGGSLPYWAEDSDEIMALVFVAESEQHSDEWLLEQITRTESFARRFPGFEQFRTESKLSPAEAVTGYLEYEAGVTSALKQIGYGDGAITPDTIGALLTKGYAIETVTASVQRWKRMQDFAPAMEAFNRILVSKGYEPIETLQDQFDFVSGVAPAEIYNLWEASSVSEAAAAAGLGDAFTAEDALRYAARTEGHTSLEDATAAFQDAAKMLLRLRTEIDYGQFGLDQEDIINLSLGVPPASGTSAAELTENINRAILSAQGSLKAKVNPFTGFSQSGVAQSQSLGSLRQS